MILHRTPNGRVYTGRWAYNADGTPRCIEVHYSHGGLSARQYLGLFESEAAARRAIEHHRGQTDK